MEEKRFTYTKVLDNPLVPVTPIRLINTISKRTVILDAIWDTGAQTSVISRRTSDVLELPRLKRPKKQLQGISGTVQSKAVLSIAMPGDDGWATIVEVDEVERIPSGYDFIIGMDIITCGDFSLAMKDGRMQLSFTFGSKFFYLPIERY